MAACKPVVFQNIARDKFNAVRARIRAQADVSVLGDSGSAQGNGFAASWIYDEPNQVLTIQCTDKPWFVSESLIADKIRALVTTI